MSNWSQCPNRHHFDAGHLAPNVEHRVVCPVCGTVHALFIDPSMPELPLPDKNGSSLDRARVPSIDGYRVINELGRGAFGVVYRTHDERAGHDVALKSLLRVDSAGLRSFKDEFRSLADVGHPNIATLYDLVSDGDTWCFTMELLDAVEFHEYVWSGFAGRDAESPLPCGQAAGVGARLSPEVTARLIDAVTQLALGLNALHSAGLLHRDIKHSNVMVTRERRVVLVDFGLATGATDESTGRVSGTPRFMAPEQTLGAAVTPAADWYAVGVMLYEILAGVPPFRGRHLEVMARKSRERPPDPRKLEPSVPEDLNDLCARLVSIRPRDRPDVEEVLRVIGAEEAITELRPPHAVWSASGQVTTELVGREEQLTQLRQHAADVAGGNGVSVFVSGRSGMGKSVLIERFLDELRQNPETLILTGRCYQQESVPFKALDALIDSLAEWLQSPDSPAASAGQPSGESADDFDELATVVQPAPADTIQVADLLPEDCLPLLRLFPVFGEVAEFEQGDRPPIDNASQPELRQRAMNALRELLRRLGEQRPLVLYVDDLQWGDIDSARLIADIMRPPAAPRLLLLGAYRSENVGNSAFLEALDKACTSGRDRPVRAEVSVDALTPEQAESLARHLLGADDEESRELAGRIADESAGSPFFVWELARHAREHTDIGGRTLQLDEVIWSRVSRLLSDTRELLELVAVVARPISAPEAFQALDRVERGRNLLQQLRAANLIRTTDAARGEPGTATIVESYHDRIRESVADRLEEDVSRAYHLKVATITEEISGFTDADRQRWLNHADDETALNARQRDRVFELALHFSESGDDDRALPYAVKAADLARRQDALEVAEQQFRIAERCAHDSPVELRRWIANGLGDILMYSGKYADAEERFATVRDLAETRLGRAQASAKLGELAFKQGDMLKAGPTIESALRDIGERVPQGLPGCLIRLGWESTIQVLHTWFPRLCLHRRGEMPNEEYVRIGLLSRLSYVQWFTVGVIPTLGTHLRELNAAERYAPSLRLAQSWSGHAPLMSTLPLHARGIRYGQNSLKIRQDRGQMWGQAQSISYVGLGFYAAGRIREAHDAFSEAVLIFEQAGDWWEANIARYQLGLTAYRLGNLEEAIDESARVHESGIQLGDAAASGITLHVWAMAADGKVPTEMVQTELDRERYDFQVTAQVQLAEAIRLYYADELEKASTWLDKAMHVIRSKMLRSAVLGAVYTWRVRVLRTRLQRQLSDGKLDNTLWRQAKHASRSALLFARFYPVDRPAAHCEAAELAVLKGRSDKARRRFEKALAEAENLDMKHDATLIRSRLAELSST